MNKLETLPTSIEYKDAMYQLGVHINFRAQLVIQYHKWDDRNTSILSYVVQPDSDPYISNNIESSNSKLNENIGNDIDLDKCIDHIITKIKESNIKIITDGQAVKSQI